MHLENPITLTAGATAMVQFGCGKINSSGTVDPCGAGDKVDVIAMEPVAAAAKGVFIGVGSAAIVHCIAGAVIAPGTVVYPAASQKVSGTAASGTALGKMLSVVKPAAGSGSSADGDEVLILIA